MTVYDNTGKKELTEVATDFLKQGKSVSIMASGYSMYPTIKPGDIITIAPLSVNANHEPDTGYLTPGVIVAIHRESDFVVHRLVQVVEHGNRRSYLTRGDSTLAPDLSVSEDQLAGLITSIERKGNTVTIKQSWLLPEWRYRLNRNVVRLISYFSKIISILKGS